MAISRRRDIIHFIRDKLKLINGGNSTLNPSYRYKTNVSENVHRRIVFLDEVNDFPSLYLQGDDEVRIYQSAGLTEAILPIAVRCYVRDEDSLDFLNNLTQDIEHVLYNLTYNALKPLGIMDITIDAISTDEGLAAPFGIGEVFLTVQYVLE